MRTTWQGLLSFLHCRQEPLQCLTRFVANYGPNMRLFCVGHNGCRRQCWGGACTNSTGQLVSLDTCTSIIQWLLLYVCVCYNSAIVSRMAKTQMDKMIDQLIKEKVKLYDMKVLCQSFFLFHWQMQQDSRFLNFLSSLCVCSGRPIPSTQSKLNQ